MGRGGKGKRVGFTGGGGVVRGASVQAMVYNRPEVEGLHIPSVRTYVYVHFWFEAKELCVDCSFLVFVCLCICVCVCLYLSVIRITYHPVRLLLSPSRSQSRCSGSLTSLPSFLCLQTESRLVIDIGGHIPRRAIIEVEASVGGCTVNEGEKEAMGA